MVVPKAVARTTAPNSQKSKYRHEMSLSIQGLTCFFSNGGGLHFDGDVRNQPLRTPVVLHAELHGFASIST
jgi:hypothetical protein